MSTNEKKPIPEDHAINEIGRLNRLDTAGFIELAKSGDTEAAKYLMKLYVRIRKRVLEQRALGFYIPSYPTEDHVLLEEYILDALTLSYRIGNANEAFNLKEKNANRPSATYKEKMKHIDIAYRVAKLIDEMPNKKYLAYSIAAKEFNISESTALNHYKKYMKA